MNQGCAICLADYYNSDEVIELDCKHIYHEGCMKALLEKKGRCCPLCKFDIKSKE